MRVSKAAELTPAQVFKLVPCLALRESVAVTFAAWLGPRGSETFGLKWNDLDLNNGVVWFRRGVSASRITLGKNRPSRTKMPLPEEVVQLLREWERSTPYNEPHDWVFASSVKKGENPLDRFELMRRHIQPVARKLGLPHISWHSFRHSLSAWGKACLTAEDRKILLRHGTIESGEDYGEIPLEKKDEITQRLRAHVLARARVLDAKENVVEPADLFSVTLFSGTLNVVAEASKAPAEIRAERVAKNAAAEAGLPLICPRRAGKERARKG